MGYPAIIIEENQAFVFYTNKDGSLIKQTMDKEWTDTFKTGMQLIFDGR